MANFGEDFSFLNDIPNETIEVLKIAFCIYNCIESKNIEIKYKDSLLDTEENLLLSKNDKQVISIFLACLKIDSDIKKILDIEKITFKQVTAFFKINIPNKDWSILDSQFIKYYFDFEKLINNISNIPQDNPYEFTLEKLFTNLLTTKRSGSKVLENFYLQLGKDCRKTYLDARKLWYDKRRTNLDNQLLQIQKEIEQANFMLNKPENIFYDNESLIEKYGKFLTSEKYLEMPAIKREEEIKRLMIILLTSSSALLVGESGVGKTSIVEGLAYYIQNNMAPKFLENKKIVKINISSLLQNTTYRGQFEEKVEKLILELKNNPDIILFIDEIHNVIGAGNSLNSSLDFANMLKPYLDRGEIKIIGATTIDEYYDYILKDPAFRRRFDKIDILEPSYEDIVEIVKSSLNKFNVRYQIDFLKNMDVDYIIRLIVFETEYESRNEDDIIYNPALVLKLFDRIYAYASFNSHECVLISDIKEAVNSYTALNEKARERLIYKLKNLENKEESESKSKILQFKIPDTKNHFN